MSAPKSPSSRDREVGALRAAWSERARCHELLTADGVPPGELEWRIAYVLAQVRTISSREAA